MGFLTEQTDNTVQFLGRRYVVNPAFDVVLEIQRLFKEELPQEKKIGQALRMLIEKPSEGFRNLSFTDQAKLLEEIYGQCIHVKKRPPVRQSMRVLDFEEDGEYIYASFFGDYGLDLIELQGILPWRKFIALFQGLSEKTKIREVMRIRSMEIPPYNGRNGKSIQQIQELKSYYALPAVGGGGQGGLDALFYALEAQAMRDG